MGVLDLWLAKPLIKVLGDYTQKKTILLLKICKKSTSVYVQTPVIPYVYQLQYVDCSNRNTAILVFPKHTIYVHLELVRFCYANRKRVNPYAKEVGHKLWCSKVGFPHAQVRHQRNVDLGPKASDAQKVMDQMFSLRFFLGPHSKTCFTFRMQIGRQISPTRTVHERPRARTPLSWYITPNEESLFPELEVLHQSSKVRIGTRKRRAFSGIVATNERRLFPFFAETETQVALCHRGAPARWIPLRQQCFNEREKCPAQQVSVAKIWKSFYHCGPNASPWQDYPRRSRSAQETGQASRPGRELDRGSPSSGRAERIGSGRRSSVHRRRRWHRRQHRVSEQTGRRLRVLGQFAAWSKHRAAHFYRQTTHV